MRLPATSGPVTVLALWRVQAGALMVLGRAAGPVPRTGTARVVGSAAARGVFRAEFWPFADGSGIAFLTAIRLPDCADPPATAHVALRGARAGDGDIELILPAASEETQFGDMVAELARGHAPAVARFMLDVMRPQDGGDFPRAPAALTAFLARAAQQDGCVELMISVPDRYVLLQGWGDRLPDPVQVLLVGPALSTLSAQTASFARPDVPGPATGIVFALPAHAAAFLPSLQTVYLLGADFLSSRTLVEHRLLDPVAGLGHIQHILPLLDGPPAMVAALRETLRPRFDGRDTLNPGPNPVRAAVDIAACAEAGAYLSGWIFDPARKLADVQFCAGGVAARIDESWVRVEREDVSEAFRNDPTVPATRAHDSGFAVAIADASASGQPAYLQFTFTDGERAFLPLDVAPLTDPAVRARIAASIDLYKPSGLPIVEQHLAPLLARLRPAEPPAAALSVAGPLERPQAIVVPLPDPVLPRAFLSGLLLDPPHDTEQLVFVCGPEWDGASLGRLRALVAFYALPGSILAAPTRPSPGLAVRAAAKATGADEFLLALPSAVGRSPGWRQRLRRACEGRDVACPTLLYEDWSIRYAGSAELCVSDATPYAEIRVPLAGLAASEVAADPTTPVSIGTLSCCFLRRSVLPAFAETDGFTTDDAQEAAFFLRAEQLGLSRVWVPAVQVYAPEPSGAAPSRVERLVDGWLLRQVWQGRH